jgi:RNA polymerase sigma factor for flagellar operon FliA
MVSLSEPPNGDEEAGGICALADPRTVAPPEVAHQHELRAAILGTLSQIEQIIMVLSFYENMTLLEIGLTLGCSESRISQIRTDILARLRVQLSGRRHVLRAA